MAPDSEHRLEDATTAQQRFLSLFLRSEREIYRYVAALIPNVKDSEDIVQQTALALWEKFDAYDPARPFTPWACRFALNKARQWIERHQRWQALLEHGLAEELAQRRQELQPAFERRLKHLENCLGKLPTDQRLLVEGYYYERTEIEPLAERSGKTVAATYKMLQRIRQTLQRCVELQAVRLDFQDFRGTDWTLRNTAERNRSASDATVVGCQRAEGRWREKQSVEFQSVNDRVLLQVPGEFESLTLAAWVRVRGLDRRLNSLFMCDGLGPGTVHWLIRNDGVLGLTVFGPGPGNFQILASPPVLTLDQFGMWLQLAVVLNGKTRQVVHYVDGVPVSRHTLKQRPPYRLGPAELGNWNPPGGLKTGPTQTRNFSGSFDEFVLFSRALTDAEIHELYLQGKPVL